MPYSAVPEVKTLEYKFVGTIQPLQPITERHRGRCEANSGTGMTETQTEEHQGLFVATRRRQEHARSFATSVKESRVCHTATSDRQPLELQQNEFHSF